MYKKIKSKKKLIKKSFYILLQRDFIEKELNKLNLTSNHLEQYDLIHYRHYRDYIEEDLSLNIKLY